MSYGGCGSRMLGGFLQSHPDVNYHFEIDLNEEDLRTVGNFARRLDRAWEPGKLLVIDQKYGALRRGFADWLELNHPRVIHLVREPEELTATIVAREECERIPLPTPARISQVRWDWWLHQVEHEIHEKSALLHSLGCPTLVLRYEEVAPDGQEVESLPEELEQRILSFLQLKPHHLTTTMKKVYQSRAEKVQIKED